MELKEKGNRLTFENGLYKLFINDEFVIEDEDLDYVLSYIKEDKTDKNLEVW